MTEEFDIFISYKTEDANEVREVAECLVANGVRMWFGEYEIRAEIYDDDQAVQRSIDDGILRSRHALVFTNDRWASSEYCALEMDGILRKFEPSSHASTGPHDRRAGAIIEVFLPKEAKPHAKWPVLKNVPAIVYRGQVGEILEFINRQQWFDRALKLPSATRIETDSEERRSLRYGASMALGRFVEAPELYPRHESRREFAGEKYYFEQALASFKIGLGININPHQSALGSLSIPRMDPTLTPMVKKMYEKTYRRYAPHQVALESLRSAKRDGVSDRLVYKAYRGYARNWLDRHHKEDKGIHLFFWNNRSHLALTSVNKERSSHGHYWERRYFLVLFSEEDEQLGQIDISFGMYLPDTDAENGRTFCGLTRMFDAVVSSIQYDPGAFWKGKELLTLLIVKLWFTVLVIGNWLSVMARSPAGRWAYLLAALSGLLSMDLVFSLLSVRVRKETLHWGSSLGPRFRPLPTFGRFLDRVWEVVVGTIAHVVLMSVGGVINVVLLLIVLVVLALSIQVPVKPPVAWIAYGAVVYVLGFLHRRTALR